MPRLLREVEHSVPALLERVDGLEGALYEAMMNLLTASIVLEMVEGASADVRDFRAVVDKSFVALTGRNPTDFEPKEKPL